VVRGDGDLGAAQPYRGDRVKGDWARRYPPLAGLALCVVIAALVLPSALNVPQTNPTTTPEIAPIPQKGDDTTAPDGGLASLGIAGGGGGAGSTTTTAPPPLVGSGSTPSGKRCVGNPPRQTEDPLSPPCVAYFDGDNGGATYKGVTAEEIRVLWHIGANEFGTSGTSRGNEAEPSPGVYDVHDAQYDSLSFRLLRLAERYFNERYQLYGRKVHFFVQVGAIFPPPEERRKEAVEGLQANPFVVVDQAPGATAEYVSAFADDDRLVFVESGGQELAVGLRQDFYRQHAGRIWSFGPSLEQRAASMVDYACTAVVNSPVSFSGVAADNGKPRKLAVVGMRDDVSFPEYTTYTKLISDGIRSCGGDIVVPDGRSTQHCWNERFSPCPEEAVQEMARYQQAGATTVLMTDNNDLNMYTGAETIRWQPEFVILGDGYGENTSGMQDTKSQAPDASAHVRAITSNALSPADPADRPCFRAAKSADPAAPDQDVRIFWCIMYPTLRTVFVGLQVAGPKLTPTAMDRGFHAIPPLRSTDPQTPACYFDPGDYSCTKDVTLMHWDQNGRTPGDTTAQGCWRMTGGGARYLRGTWPDRQIDDRARPDDPCSLIGPPSVTG
jgi:hypothetical protein